MQSIMKKQHQMKCLPGNYMTVYSLEDWLSFSWKHETYDEHVLKGFLYVVENNGCDDWFTVYMNMILYDMILIDTGCISEGFFV